jgi:hypothetical protein
MSARQKFEQQDEKFAKWCPQTWQIISGRRYVVPDYRAQDYANQVELISSFKRYFDHLLLRMPIEDDWGTHFDNLTRALAHNRPTYFLERELGEAFCRTELPADLELSVIKWKFPQMRILLPLGLLHLEGEKLGTQTGPFSYPYLDIFRIDKGRKLELPKEVAIELESCTPIARILEERGLFPQPSLNPPEADGAPVAGVGLCSMCIVANRPWYRAIWSSQRTLDIPKINQSMDLKGSYSGDEQEWFLKAQHLALNILLFMSSSPADVQPLEELRKPRVVGDRFVSGFYKARFIGDAQRKRVRNQPEVLAEKIARTGLESAHAAHWVAGSWRQQPHGPKSSLRKLIWVQPYFAQGNKEARDE